MSHKASRSGLFLLELILSILFFSIAGAICVRLFVSSHMLSRNSIELNHALEWTQNVAELFYGCNGNSDQMLSNLSNIYYVNADQPSGFCLIFDQDFNPIEFESTDLTGFSSAGYAVIVNISEDKELIYCNICTQKLPLLAASEQTEPVYQLNLTLFPSREASDGK